MGSKIKEISVSLSKKIGLPKYSSVSIMASATYSVDESNDLKEAFKKGWKDVGDEIAIQEQSIENNNRETEDPTWLNEKQPNEIRGVNKLNV